MGCQLVANFVYVFFFYAELGEIDFNHVRHSAKFGRTDIHHSWHSSKVSRQCGILPYVMTEWRFLAEF